MIGIRTKDGFLDFSKITFNCPNCNKEYSDSDDKYLKRINASKEGQTRIKCTCGKPFYMTYSFMGEAVSFK
jgi:peptide subunit release factor 1 (eRF1)